MYKCLYMYVQERLLTPYVIYLLLKSIGQPFSLVIYFIQAGEREYTSSPTIKNRIRSVYAQKQNQMAEEADSSGGENSTWTKAESTFNK